MFTLLLDNNVYLGKFSHCDNNKINIANSTKDFFFKNTKKSPNFEETKLEII